MALALRFYSSLAHLLALFLSWFSSKAKKAQRIFFNPDILDDPAGIVVFAMQHRHDLIWAFLLAMRYHRGNREQEMWSRHTGATLWSAANVKTLPLFNNQMHHLSPRAKNQQLSSDWFRCKCCSHKRWKMTLVSHFLPPPLCALLCKLSGVFVTAWCWRKQQQAELWIANVPWGGWPRFDILNKLQIRQAGRGSSVLLISLPHHSQIRGALWKWELTKFRHFCGACAPCYGKVNNRA